MYIHFSQLEIEKYVTVLPSQPQCALENNNDKKAGLRCN
jgi:hypothetical protein